MSAMMNEAIPSMTIGEVLSQLSPDFPDISISKIRFLEGEGLIAPRRAPSGYRRFTPADVDQLRHVLLAQRDHYLPLRIIKDHIEAGTLRDLVDPEPAPVVEVQVEPTISLAPGPADAEADVDPKDLFTRREIATRSGLTPEHVEELTESGVITADPSSRYSGADLLVCRAVAALREYGVETRHLRAVKNSASRDSQLIGNAVNHLTDEDRSQAIRTMLQAFSDAHYWQVMAQLNRQTPIAGQRRARGGR